MPDDELVTVGRVVRPHGVRGELVVEAAGEVLGELEPGARVLLDPGGERTVASLRPHKARWLLGLEGIDDRDAAELLRGSRVRVDDDLLPETAEDEFYIDELLGAEVETADGEALGRVAAIHSGAAQDLLEVRGEGRVRLVPMVRDWLVEVDATAGRIVLELPAGFDEATGVVRPGKVSR